ncbi:LacI family transcriptional regulator [Rhodocaloribacter litoris]|uniref:LacI family DNA-binding transcriptional regulator n=1 Tax=Rhodocaloribacter litoris TaxID=2558931 RepID=UPI0014203D5F|nr:LacI family DNA-binding transcriptional regulator [Rhodocaloribacter litoris]QXD15371.1 LacI family transcriptional regulator [Rhodocaloribacter litoris]
MPVTIRDVARAAGVSPSTVSRAFNNSPLVKPETREHVLRIAAKMRYVPNATARNLTLQKTEVLGLILPKPREEFYLELIRGTDEAASQAGYKLLISSTNNRLEDVVGALQTMHGMVDGLLINSPHHDVATLSHLLPEDLPVVFLQSAIDDEPFDCFRIANRRGAYLAVKHLIDLGHRQIALIKSEEQNFETRERLQGCYDAFREAGITPEPTFEFTGTFTQESGYRAGVEFLKLDRRPTAIFAFDDHMAIGALRAIREAGLSVPDDVAIIGFDDVMSARLAIPPLSSVRVPVRDMGAQAVYRLIELLDTWDHRTPETIELPAELVIRASTAGN